MINFVKGILFPLSQTLEIAIWYKLLSIQNEAISLVVLQINECDWLRLKLESSTVDIYVSVL